MHSSCTNILENGHLEKASGEVFVLYDLGINCDLNREHSFLDLMMAILGHYQFMVRKNISFIHHYNYYLFYNYNGL